jgi:hypothetical protein
MANMHKGYAYQIFNYVAYKTFTRIQPNFPKQNQHEQNQKQIIGERIEPKFYKELCLIITQVSCPTTPHTNPPQPHKINHHQLTTLQTNYVRQSSCNFPKYLESIPKLNYDALNITIP